MKYNEILDLYQVKIEGHPNQFFKITKLDIGGEFKLNLQSIFGNVKVECMMDSISFWIVNLNQCISFCFPRIRWNSTIVMSIPLFQDEKGVWKFDVMKDKTFIKMNDEVPEELEIELMRPFRGGNNHEVSGCDE